MAGRLVFFCGKMAAGKSTLARAIAAREGGVLLEQDALLAALYPGEIADIPSFRRKAQCLRDALGPVVTQLLARGATVVMDFPGNTRAQRAWFRSLFEAADAQHELHVIDVPDDVCKRQLRERSARLPAGAPFTTNAEFDAITRLFEPVEPDEGFHVVRHSHTH